MARTSSIYLTPVTLTFNLPEKMFQIALLLLEDNNCAKSFWNPCINVPVMAWASSIYDHFDLYLTPVTMTFNLPKKCLKWHFPSSRATTVPNCFEIHALLYKLWSGQIRTDAHTYTELKLQQLCLAYQQAGSTKMTLQRGSLVQKWNTVKPVLVATSIMQTTCIKQACISLHESSQDFTVHSVW